MASSHNLAAAKRLRKELQSLERQVDVDDDVYLRPSNSDSILKWTALLRGPSQTPYEGGVFQLSIQCGPDYPLAPPTITFVTKVSAKFDLALLRLAFDMEFIYNTNGIFTYSHSGYKKIYFLKVFHPNVHFTTGEVCLDILKKEWSPAWGLQAACRAVLALLSDPDADSPLNCDAGNMIRGGDTIAYRSTAKLYAVENAMFLEWPLGTKE